MRPSTLRPALLALLLAACATVPGGPAASPASSPASSASQLELVESWPAETSLDHPDLRDAKDVWPELLGSATRTLDVAQFYLSTREGSTLERSIRALEEAAARGVRVRVLAEEAFARTYPETLARLAARPGIEVRRWDTRKDLGGILHAKYFVVDGREAYLGSQNFDWRALEHIQEVGLRVQVPTSVRALADVFAHDWALAGGEPPPAPVGLQAAWVDAQVGGAPARVLTVASPEGHLPASVAWDLPELVRLIDGATRSVRVQLLTYRMKSREGERFAPLEDALLRAAGRGVKVELMVADWTKRPGTIEALQALHAPHEGLTVKLVTIPQHSGGHIPFARVVHSKYLVVDGRAAWVGTSNWERDYFHGSRNVGLVVESPVLAGRLESFFADLWGSAYATEVDPTARYTPPDVAGAEGK